MLGLRLLLRRRCVLAARLGVGHRGGDVLPGLDGLLVGVGVGGGVGGGLLGLGLAGVALEARVAPLDRLGHLVEDGVEVVGGHLVGRHRLEAAADLGGAALHLDLLGVGDAVDGAVRVDGGHPLDGVLAVGEGEPAVAGGREGMVRVDLRGLASLGGGHGARNVRDYRAGVVAPPIGPDVGGDALLRLLLLGGLLGGPLGRLARYGDAAADGGDDRHGGDAGGYPLPAGGPALLLLRLGGALVLALFHLYQRSFPVSLRGARSASAPPRCIAAPYGGSAPL